MISQGRGRLTVHDPDALAAMSTELRETSYGGVVVRGDEVLVITPAGQDA